MRDGRNMFIVGDAIYHLLEVIQHFGDHMG